MPVLMTSRLNCSPAGARLALFLALQQHPEVMRFVAENRPVAAIREAFDSRLTPRRRSAHWLCLVVRDALSHPAGVTGYIHREEDCAEVGFLLPRGAGQRLRLRIPAGALRLRLSSGRYSSAHRHRHRGKRRLQAPAGKSSLPAGRRAT